MLKRLASASHELDEWLHQHVGRMYVAILGWGLIVSIIGSLGMLRGALSGDGDRVSPVVVLVFQTALLINQLAQWHDLQEQRTRRKGSARRQAIGRP